MVETYHEHTSMLTDAVGMRIIYKFRMRDNI